MALMTKVVANKIQSNLAWARPWCPRDHLLFHAWVLSSIIQPHLDVAEILLWRHSSVMQRVVMMFISLAQSRSNLIFSKAIGAMNKLGFLGTCDIQSFTNYF